MVTGDVSDGPPALVVGLTLSLRPFQAPPSILPPLDCKGWPEIKGRSDCCLRCWQLDSRVCPFQDGLPRHRGELLPEGRPVLPGGGAAAMWRGGGCEDGLAQPTPCCM